MQTKIVIILWENNYEFFDKLLFFNAHLGECKGIIRPGILNNFRYYNPFSNGEFLHNQLTDKMLQSCTQWLGAASGFPKRHVISVLQAKNDNFCWKIWKICTFWSYWFQKMYNKNSKVVYFNLKWAWRNLY